MLQTRVLTPRSRTTHVVWARNGRGASAPGRRNRGADIINKREPASAISGDATTRNRTKFHLSKAGRKRKPTVQSEVAVGAAAKMTSKVGAMKRAKAKRAAVPALQQRAVASRR